MIRYAILKAVSSAAQMGDDKVSLSVQENRARETARAKGWAETAGPYSIEGQSRLLYASLNLAEAAIPELKRMLDDAQRHAFDVLIVWDYDRFRDLLGMVSKTLSHYRVQIYAVNLPIEPLPPEQYTPYKTDLSAMMEALAMLKQKAATNDLRRKYAEAMPQRASKRGLPVQIPWGYKKPINSKTPPELDAHLTPYLVQMKDMFLAGKSTTDIAAWMNTTSLPPRGKTWYPQTIKQILTNPFYGGLVRWGITRAELDPRTGRVKRNRQTDMDQVASGPGLHTPVWDQYTSEALIQEFKRRGKTYEGKLNQTLSGLLICGICGQRLWVFYQHNVTGDNMIWRCSSRQEHVTLRNPAALDRVARAMAHDITRFYADPGATESNTEAEVKQTLDDLKAQRERLTHAYTIGLLTMEELSHQKPALDERIREQEHLAETYLRAERDTRDRRLVLEALKNNLHNIPAWLRSQPASELNYVLRKIFSEITVPADSDELTLHWR